MMLKLWIRRIVAFPGILLATPVAFFVWLMFEDSDFSDFFKVWLKAMKNGGLDD
jgi:hypothetical protein